MIAQRGNQDDWFYGASAALPKAAEWHIWFNYHQEKYDHSQPIEKFVVDATMKLHQTYIKLAVAVRKNAGWTRQFTEVEMNHILDIVGEADAWVTRNRPRDDQLEAYDRRLVFIVRALAGLSKVAVALGQEIDQANRKGYVLVDAGAEDRALGSNVDARG